MESNDKLEQLLRQMYAQEPLHDEDIDTSDIVDEEWTKFEAEHFGDEERQAKRVRFSFLKIAAVFIGILMLSGISFAAIHIIRGQEAQDRQQETVAVAPTQRSTVNAQQTEPDLQANPVVFEDAELKAILSEVAAFYQVEVVYKSEPSKHVRLYFTWDKKQSLDDIIGTFNKFERICITHENQKLIVE